MSTHIDKSGSAAAPKIEELDRKKEWLTEERKALEIERRAISMKIPALQASQGVLDGEWQSIATKEKLAALEARQETLEGELRARAAKEIMLMTQEFLKLEERVMELRHRALAAHHEAVRMEGEAIEAKRYALRRREEIFEIERNSLIAKVDLFKAKHEEQEREAMPNQDFGLDIDVAPDGSSDLAPTKMTPGRQVDEKAATLLYHSGEDIRLGDVIECAGGLKGAVTVIVKCGPESHPAFPASPRIFIKLGAARVGFDPRDPSVRLLSRAKRMASSVTLKTIKKVEFLHLLEELGAQHLYHANDLVKWLSDCGLSTSAATDSQGIIIEGQLLPLGTPEWGKPGISSSNVLSVVYELATGQPPSSRMTGRGFWFKDVMNKLAVFWGLEGKYL